MKVIYVDQLGKQREGNMETLETASPEMRKLYEEKHIIASCMFVKGKHIYEVVWGANGQKSTERKIC